MNATAKLEISVLAAAFTLGVLGDALLRCFPWGVNFALWAGLLAAAIFFLGRARRQAFAEGGWWLLLPLALSPLAFLWHDSPALEGAQPAGAAHRPVSRHVARPRRPAAGFQPGAICSGQPHRGGQCGVWNVSPALRKSRMEEVAQRWAREAARRCCAAWRFPFLPC